MRRYSEGIAHYVSGRTDQAIEQLVRAARLRTDVIGLYLILGDLYRMKGLFDRAIRIHSGLLSRPDVNRAESAQAQASLCDDFQAAGLVDRAREACEKALEIDPRNLRALGSMLRYRIEERRWEEALALEERLIRLDSARRSRSLAFLYTEIGRERLRDGDERLAHRNFQKAVAVDDRTFPAHIFLGDDCYKNGDVRRALQHWEHVVDLDPRRLHLVFDRLETAYADAGNPEALEELCLRVVEREPTDWRTRVLLARLETAKGDQTAAFRYLLEAARIFPRSLTVQQEMWKLTLQSRGPDARADRSARNVQAYLDLIRTVNDFSDPFSCATCRFETLEYLWRCPRCFTWDAFVESHGPAAGMETTPAAS
jgi:lipopolysaccharide biosynthesis regulator YciM